MNKTFDEVSAMTEDQAREYLESIRWPNGPVCIQCGDVDNVYRLAGKATRAGLLKCRSCKKQFTVTVGGVMEDSHIPLRKWAMAFHLVCASKKGISALQLKRSLSLGSYQTAWHMVHRIRHAMSPTNPAPLTGIVEVDETYVGGKPRRGTGNTRTGRGTAKIPVIALVSRDGGVRTRVIERVDAKTLKAAIRENVDRSATIMTDEWKSYEGIGKEFKGGHFAINHGKGEYSRGRITTNTVESYFGLLKRGVYGTFHHVSKQHLQRYCDEFSFRWSLRKENDEVRTHAAIQGAEGKRLRYA